MILITRWRFLGNRKRQLPNTYDMYSLIQCDSDVAEWIEAQEKILWHREETSANSFIYWINEKMITLLILSWPQNNGEFL